MIKGGEIKGRRLIESALQVQRTRENGKTTDRKSSNVNSKEINEI